MGSRINFAVWHWNKITPNEFIGGMSMKVGDVLELTKDETVTSWFKLLNEKLSKFTDERLVVDENEKAKVRIFHGEGGGEAQDVGLVVRVCLKG